MPFSLNGTDLKTALILLGGTLLLARLLPWLLGAVLARFAPSVRTLVRVSVSGIILVVGISSTASALGIPAIAAFGVGITSVTIGFATAQAGQSLLAGAWILLEGDVDLGDVVRAGTTFGTVEGPVIKIRLRAVVIRWTDPATRLIWDVPIPTQTLFSTPFAVVPAERVTGEPIAIAARERGRVLRLIQEFIRRLHTGGSDDVQRVP